VDENDAPREGKKIPPRTQVGGKCACHFLCPFLVSRTRLKGTVFRDTNRKAGRPQYNSRRRRRNCDTSRSRGWRPRAPANARRDERDGEWSRALSRERARIVWPQGRKAKRSGAGARDHPPSREKASTSAGGWPTGPAVGDPRSFSRKGPHDLLTQQGSTAAKKTLTGTYASASLSASKVNSNESHVVACDGSPRIFERSPRSVFDESCFPTAFRCPTSFPADS